MGSDSASGAEPDNPRVPIRDTAAEDWTALPAAAAGTGRHRGHRGAPGGTGGP
jgi:hypothetical protein